MHKVQLYYLLTPWSRVLLEKRTGSAASQEIPRIFGTQRFLTVLTSARHLSLSWANSIQSPQPLPLPVQLYQSDKNKTLTFVIKNKMQQKYLMHFTMPIIISPVLHIQLSPTCRCTTKSTSLHINTKLSTSGDSLDTKLRIREFQFSLTAYQLLQFIYKQQWNKNN
jgi:hypothetical protein